MGSRAWTIGLGAAFAVALALRLPPLALVIPGPDLQEAYARQAMLALADRSWEPTWPGHGPGFFTLLRASFTAWYALGWLGGWWTDRIDMLASFFGAPYPFLLVARLVVVAFAVGAVGLTARLGRAVFGDTAGLVAGVALAIMFTHVRESVQLWPDVPAACLVLAAVAAAVRPHVGLAALLAGAAIATKHSAAPVVLPVIGAVLTGGQGLARRLALGGTAALAGYVLLAPTVLGDPRAVLDFLRMQAMASFGADAEHLSLARIVAIGVGWPLAALAALGALAALAGAQRRTAFLLLAFPVAYLVVIAGAGRLFARYLALASPFIALFAGYGVVTLARAAGRHGRLAAAIGFAAACLPPLWHSVVYVRTMSRTDTRVLAGDWIAQHAWPNALVVLPHFLAAPHPVIPGVISPRLADPRMRLPVILAAKERLASRGAPQLKLRTLGSLDRFKFPRFEVRSLVVVAKHPVVLHDPKFDLRVRVALASLGGRRRAQFASIPDEVPPGVVFDPLDGDYTPLVGGNLLERPGPNITIWDVAPPPKPTRRRPAWKRRTPAPPAAKAPAR